MKNSIKTLSLILLALISANTSFAVNYSYNGTTWTPTFSTLTNSDSVTLTGGTWNLGANTTVRGINLQGGTLSMANRNITGRVHVSNSAAISSTGGTINGTLATTSGTLTLGSNLTATRVNLKGGTLAIGVRTLTSNVTVLATSTLTANTTGNIQALTLVSGTLNLVGRLVGTTITFNGGNLAIGASRYLLSGGMTVSSAATISGSSTGKVYFNSNNSDLVINGGDLTINGTELVTDNITFTSNNDIVVTNGGLLSLNFSTQHNHTTPTTNKHVIGNMRVYIADNNNNSFIMPIGDATRYAPVQITPTGSNITNNNLLSDTFANYINVSYVGSKNPNPLNDNTLVSASGHEYWVISTSSNNPAAQIAFFVNTTGTNYGRTVLGSTANISTDLEIAQFNTSTNKWTVLAAGVGGASNGGVPVTSTASIAPNTSFTFGSTQNRTTFVTPLPVSIIDFSAKANDVNIEVKWSTASEKDNAAFVVEKSIDGQIWSAIGTVRGAKTSNVVNNYGLVDFKAVAGVQYYRLKQIDLDGTVNYSKAIAVNFSKASTLNVNLFPNPAKDALNITTENNASGEVNIQILNSMGETVYNQVVQAGLVQNIDIASFIPGVYYVTVIAEGETKIIRLLKN